nr:helix-turn-helix domain-containing protein [Chloroflexota bacterium]
LTDNAYNAHLARKAEEQARRIGARLRELREGRHLTGSEAASRAGLTTEGLSRIEQGRDKAAFQALDRLLKAMGYSWRDLSADTLSLEGQVTR